MQHTSKGRITEEALADLEAWANKYPKPWTMGVSSYAMKAIIAELRELREKVKTNGVQEQG